MDNAPGHLHIPLMEWQRKNLPIKLVGLPHLGLLSLLRQVQDAKLKVVIGNMDSVHVLYCIKFGG